MKKRNHVLIFMIIVLLSGCSTILHGSKQTIIANSRPAGAAVLVDGTVRGITPASIQLPRNGVNTITIRKEGYEDIVIPFDKHFKIGSTIIGNIFSWSVIGIVVDIANGSAYELEPQDVQAMLAYNKIPVAVSSNSKMIDVHFFMAEEYTQYQESGGILDTTTTSTVSQFYEEFGPDQSIYPTELKTLLECSNKWNQPENRTMYTLSEETIVQFEGKEGGSRIGSLPKHIAVRVIEHKPEYSSICFNKSAAWVKTTSLGYVNEGN